MSRVTLRDVACRAGVSVRTVSNVVNDYRYVAAHTRERVQAAIAELGYRPNLAARQLRTGQRLLIRLVLPELDSPYFAEIAAATARAAEQRGWSVHIVQTHGEPKRERMMLSGSHGPGADGIIVSPWAITSDDIEHRPSAPPLVVLGERPVAGSIDGVAIDDAAAAAEATGHLLAGGRRRVAVIGRLLDRADDTGRLRLEGYRRALAAAGREPDASLDIPVERRHLPDGARAMRRLLRQTNDIDGVFCFSDQLALGAMHVLAASGRSIPGDVGVVGCNDIEAGRYSLPTLSTIAPDKAQLVTLALDCLAARLAGHTLAARLYRVAHRLIVRQSSAACR